MNEKTFWNLIERGIDLSDADEKVDAIREGLLLLEPGELLEFDQLFERKLAEAFTWDLWGAAHIINGGCSRDDFCYFRAWLLSLGQHAFEDALQDPGSLADLVDSDGNDCGLEQLWYLAGDVYREKTGKDLPSGDVASSEPAGDRWDFEDEDEMLERLPALAEKFS